MGVKGRRYPDGVIELVERRARKITHGLHRAEAAELLEELAALAGELEADHRGERGLRPLTQTQADELEERWAIELRRFFGRLIARLAAFLAAIIPRPDPDAPKQRPPDHAAPVPPARARSSPLLARAP